MPYARAAALIVVLLLTLCVPNAHAQTQPSADLRRATLTWSPNGRFAVHMGYQFSRQSYFLIGAAYDAGGDPFYDDGRRPVRYDGGFGRVVVMW